MNLSAIASQDPIANPLFNRVMRPFIGVALSLPKQTQIVLKGEEHLPESPAIFAPNHTHKLDFLPLRYALYKRDMLLVTWIKSRAFKDPLTARFLGYTGNIPLSSRGYLIAADFENLVGRRPTEKEYRILRNHIDNGDALPENQIFKELLTTPRAMLDFGFHPSSMSYREAQQALYFASMEVTLRLARQCLNAGHHMHFYPQGAVSSRLTKGKIGIIEAALALRLPIIPVGISGCREVFVGPGLRSRGGTITIQIGAPIRIDEEAYPKDFRPFHPDDEEASRPQLQADADRIMERINALIAPSYQWAGDGENDGKVGIDRFY